MQLIPLLLFTSACCVGAHIAADEIAYTMTNGNAGIGQMFPQKWIKPVITCPTCMASVWGLASCIIFNIEPSMVIPFVLALAYTNSLLYRWVS